MRFEWVIEIETGAGWLPVAYTISIREANELAGRLVVPTKIRELHPAR